MPPWTNQPHRKSSASEVERIAALADVQSLLAIARELNRHVDRTQYDFGKREGIWFALNHLIDARTAREHHLNPALPTDGLPCRCHQYLTSHMIVGFDDDGKPQVNCFCGCTKFEPIETENSHDQRPQGSARQT